MILNKKVSTPVAILVMIVLSALAGIFVWQHKSAEEPPRVQESLSQKENVPQGIMILIEYKSMDGLSNMVNELQKRNIHSLLHVGPDFVEENCEGIKKLTNYNVSIVGGCGEPLWDLSYEEQKEAISDTQERIEACTDKPLEFVTSPYWGWDQNTVKIADELGIKNIFARGLVGNGAAIFKPEEYGVKILSVSNIESIDYKYGSVCDYSYWVRDGEPSDMLAELDDAVYDNKKVSPVSHTNIGGLKKDWLDMWLKFFDSGKVNWVSWEEFSNLDYEMPLNRMPSNENVPYTPEMRQGVEERYQQGEDVENPCRVEDLPETEPVEENDSEVEEEKEEIIMFHNNKGPMCLEAKEFFQKNDIEFKEVLTTDDRFYNQLNEYKRKYPESEGVSDSYGYYPFIFTQKAGYSGFNEEIKEKILEDLEN